MKRVAIFQYDFGIGGIQKALINLLKDLIPDQVIVDVFYFLEGDLFEQLPNKNNISYHRLTALHSMTRFIPFQFVDSKKVRGILSREIGETEYDLAIDYNSYKPECAIAVNTCHAKKRVIWLHNDVEKVYRNEVKFRILWHFMKRKYDLFDEVIGVSEGVIDPFIRLYKPSRNMQFRVIPNSIDFFNVRKKSEEEVVDPEVCINTEHVNIFSIGRLCHQKGFDELIDLFVQAHESNPKLELWIIGDGEEKRALNGKVQKYEAGQYIHLMGKRINPYAYLKSADAFVLNSRYEGQGIVLWEAAALDVRLIFPKRLEKYNMYLSADNNLLDALKDCTKGKVDYSAEIHDYQEMIQDSFNSLLLD